MAKKILVVEDNDLNRALLRDILEYRGYDVAEAANGAAGVDQAREQRPDLVLLDIQMPLMDGFAVIAALRKEPSLTRTKIIALTSYAMMGDRDRIMAAGFDGYLAKPIDTRALPKLVGTWLEEDGGDG